MRPALGANQLHSLIATVPDAIRAQLRGLSTPKRVGLARYRSGDPLASTGAATRAPASVAQGWSALDAEVGELDPAIKTILDTIAAPLLARHGVAYETAAALLTTAGDNPERIGRESSYAALCGSSPVEGSSGRSNRHQLNRAGDRQANSALWHIVMVRLRSRHAPTIDYLERRTTDGLSRREIIRGLKRYVAREVFADIETIMTDQRSTETLRNAA